jgi:hypothetical protein
LGNPKTKASKAPVPLLPSRRVDEEVAGGVTILSAQQMGVPQFQAGPLELRPTWYTGKPWS